MERRTQYSAELAGFFVPVCASAVCVDVLLNRLHGILNVMYIHASTAYTRNANSS